MNAARRLPIRPVRGLVTAVAMMFLIATVVFALGAMLVNSSSAVVDGQRQADSTAAFFLAESALDVGTANVLGASALTEGVCSTVLTDQTLGRGTYSLSGVAPQSPCGGPGQPLCSMCTLTGTGKVGQAVRTVSSTVSLRVIDGETCNIASGPCNNQPLTKWLDLKNPNGVAAVGVFAMAVGKQGAQTGATCTNASCALAWDSQQMAGQNAVQSQGNVVTIPANTSYRIYQTGATDDWAQVGILFRGSAAAPVVTGRRTTATGPKVGAAYWDANNNNSTLSKGPSAGLTGFTNDGTATDSATQLCLDPTDTGNRAQTCTSWCYGGDTLVYGFAAQADTLNDSITAVKFNTNTGGAAPGASEVEPQDIPLTPFIADYKYPTVGTAGNPPATVYASLWYRRNPVYNSAGDLNSGAQVTGSVGTFTTVNFTGDVASSTKSTLSVTNISGGTLAVGDVITGGGIDSGTVICAAAAGGGNGTYTISKSGNCSPVVAQAGAINSKPMSVNKSVVSTTLTVTASSRPYLEVGDTISGTGVTAGTTITGLGTGTGGNGTYTISPAQAFASTTITSNGRMVTSATGTAVPTAGTLVSVKGATSTGILAAGLTTVESSPAPTATVFKLSQRPKVRLVNATLCGGTCAFFKRGGNTQFTLTKSPTGLSWASGFMCLKGVDITPETVRSSRVNSTRWSEQIQ